MKLVMAIIKPSSSTTCARRWRGRRRRDDGLRGKGYGRQKGHTEIYRGAEYAVNSCRR